MVRLLISQLRKAGIRKLAAVSLTMATMGLIHCAQAADSVRNYPLYYRLGGVRATDFAASGLETFKPLSGPSAPHGSVCGGFNRNRDVLDMLSHRIEDSLTALSAVPQAISGALPGSILCRAKPGLCQLLQHYVVRAENRWNLSVDECRADFNAAAREDSPHRDLLEAARTEAWQQAAERGTSAPLAKRAADSSEGCVAWLGGRRAGCLDADPIWLLRDTAQAGWCQLMGQSGECQGASATDSEDQQLAPLRRIWSTPAAAGQWVVNVLGDFRIQAGESVETIAGAGLLPQIDRLTEQITEALTAKVYNTTLRGKDIHLNLEGANLVLAVPLITALRDLPDRDFLITRLANEAALAEVVERAFLARRLLLSGLMEPYIQSVGGVADTISRQVTILEQEIDRANWEMQARRRMVAGTVLEVLAAHRAYTTPAPARRITPKFLLK